MAEAQKVNLIDSGPMEPALSMAADEVLARRLSRGERTDTLHLYRRDRPTVSVGYSRKVKDHLDLDACHLESVRVLRRISGGGTIFTGPGVWEYGIASTRLASLSVEECFEVVCGCITGALTNLGFDAVFKKPNDILIDGYKVSGSAQNRKGPAVLQHGTVILDMDFATVARCFPWAEVLADGRGVKFHGNHPRKMTSLRALAGKSPDDRDIKEAFLRELEERLGWQFEEDEFTPAERVEMGRLVKEKWGDDNGWNLRM